MDNFSDSKATNETLNMEGGIENRLPEELCTIIIIIINGITCPLTVLLNVLVMMAVKRRPRLRSYTNILLACLAATDVLTGLVVQPSFIVWQTFGLHGIAPETYTIRHFHTSSLRAVSVCSCLHLMLVTCERLTAIKFTMRYPYIITTRNIKTAVMAVWIITLACEVPRQIPGTTVTTPLNLLVAVVLFSCVFFVTFSYVILYSETRRHQKQIKAGQLPQEAVERFVKESKALKTTVFVVGAVMLCFLPTVLIILYSNLLAAGGLKNFCPHLWIRTVLMLSSLVNPLIYCWRQKEIRRFVFRTQSAPVAPGV